jgi:hypothetical protein
MQQQQQQAQADSAAAAAGEVNLEELMQQPSDTSGGGN